ncbi:glycine cleavage system aminomethyltransferase GcvT [Erythrobacter sp. SDW2]|uniref:glycine cleavage system aminomethyltransferase GcvT n=1 Tax=Erythrobacter sp. SDW2 TaxID=2907154 RepID=UPI001F16A938|nr:glycine cleavage system aminomethyltransferase GcvT [Erythrobacter sp. SDW2]UIP06734.1 glycine cleavage system aminomethyltransferase GcvT [Erythrobacter sp. SDW2]
MSDIDIDSDDEVIEPGKLPLDAWHRAQGARMVPFAGYEMPIQYEGIVAEHEWTRTSAGLFDVSHMGQLLLSGPDLDAAVEAVLPIDLSTLKLGQQRYSLLLDEDGGVLDDLMVSRWPEALYLVVNGATKWDDIGHLREFLPDEITLNHLDDRALLALQGPKAADALARHAEGEYPLSVLTFMKFGRFTIAGHDVTIARAGYTGEDGFEISLPAEAAEEIATLLCGEPEVKPIGLGARDSLRLEAGLPLYGHDLSPETSPIEAGLIFGINKRRRTEGGYPGAERINREIAEGTARKWVGLKVEGRMPAREGAEVYAGEAKVGIVTSGGFSPSLGYPIAMATIASEHAAPGTALEIEVRNKRLAATVVPTPFVPHRYYRGSK